MKHTQARQRRLHLDIADPRLEDRGKFGSDPSPRTGGQTLALLTLGMAITRYQSKRSAGDGEGALLA